MRNGSLKQLSQRNKQKVNIRNLCIFFLFTYISGLGKGKTRCPPPIILDSSEDDHGDDLEYQSYKKQESGSDADMESEEDNNLESLPVNKLKERLASEVNHTYRELNIYLTLFIRSVLNGLHCHLPLHLSLSKTFLTTTII